MHMHANHPCGTAIVVLVALPSLPVQASAHQPVAKELKKDAALTACVAEILKQPAAVREEFLEQWRQRQWQSVVQCSGTHILA